MSGRKIAVIGGGISGLTAAHILARTNEVTVFEADDRLGGHVDTRMVSGPGGQRVELGVETQASDMSMSVSCAGCGVQYAGKRGPAGLGAGLPRGRTSYLRMLAEVPRFHRSARRLLAAGGTDDLSFGDFLRTGRFSAYFTAHFAAPLVAAMWSCSPGMALRYPAGYLFAFLANHGMLSVSGSPQWRTVTGGSRRYVEQVATRLAKVRLAAPVRSVRRYPDGADVRDASGEVLSFDAVVFATHPDQALRLPRGENHRDYIVTLGGLSDVDPSRVVAVMHYAHPAYTCESVAAQRRLPGLTTTVTAFAGAYHGWGFHEDGCRSGVAAAAALGGSW